MLRKKLLIDVNSEDYLWFSEKPLNLGGKPKKLSISEIERKFNFKYLESIWVGDELSEHNFGHEPEFQSEWLRINKYLQNPIKDKLVICYIDSKVGHGVFARDLIKAGTIVAIYSGEVIRRSSSDISDYGMAIKDGKNNNFSIDAQHTGGIARFIQHMPLSTDRIINFMTSLDFDSFFSCANANGIVLRETEDLKN